MILFFLFILGLCFGSFLNVLIDRLPKGKSVVRGRSFCDHCKHKLGWDDLIPVLSFILLNRRCRYCGKKISWHYPIVELTTGILFLFVYSLLIGIIRLDNNHFYYIYTYYLIITSCLLAIFVTDLKYRIIPDEVLIVQIVTALFYQVLFQKQILKGNILTGVVFLLVFLFLVIITKGKGIGLGDVKLAFVMGLVLGFPKIIVALYLSFLTGAVFSLILVLLKIKSLKSTIAFGPFLCAATFVTLFYGNSLWSLFKGILGI